LNGGPTNTESKTSNIEGKLSNAEGKSSNTDCIPSNIEDKSSNFGISLVFRRQAKLFDDFENKFQNSK